MSLYVEDGHFHGVEPVSYLDGTYGGSRVATLGTGNNTVYFTRSAIGIQSGGIPVATRGILAIILDKGGLFLAGCDPQYPQSQTGDFASLVALARMEVNPQAYRPLIYPQNTYPFPIPYNESEGDRILVDIGGTGPVVNGVIQPVPIQFMWSLNWTTGTPV